MAGELIRTGQISKEQKDRTPVVVIRGSVSGGDSLFLGDIGLDTPTAENPFEVYVPKDTDSSIKIGLGKKREWHEVKLPDGLELDHKTIALNALQTINICINQNKED